MAKERSKQDVTIVDGSLDFSAGVNSYLVPTVASEINPNGLGRNQVAWLNNGTFRGGGITQRPSWIKLGILPPGATGLYQGSFMYEPDSGDPYLIMAIGGHIWRVDPDDPTNAVDLSLISYSTPGQTAVVTDQVTLSCTNIDDTAVYRVGGVNGTIGYFGAFVVPAILSSVRIAVTKPWGGAIPTTFDIAMSAPAANYRIDSVTGYVIVGGTPAQLIMPPDIGRYYFCQAEQFLVIQCGDMLTNPFIWDGSNLRQSVGLSGTGGPNTPDYYGVSVGFMPIAFTTPNLLNATFTFNLSVPYGGLVGDYLTIVTSPSVTGGFLMNYGAALATFYVTAIGPGNSLTCYMVGWSSTIPRNATINSGFSYQLFKLIFVYPTPSHGENLGSGTSEIPPATAMDYYQGRLWYAQGRQYAAGDIVRNQTSGTLSYNYRDSVVKVTENPLAIGGDGFSVPTNAGNIVAIKHSANINTTLGEGQLYIFTRKAIYELTVPVTRTDWINADTNNMPRQGVAQLTNGAVNDRTVTEQNGDLFYQSFEPSIRSLVLAMRYYDQWGNTPISINVDRILKFNNLPLMEFSSGISFDNRMLQLVLPEESAVGVVHRAVVPLNFDVISTLEEKRPPVWEGMYEGLAFMELFTGDFSGTERAIGAVFNETSRAIELWEISKEGKFENGDNRIAWYIEFPAYTWGDEFLLKKLVSAEIWLDRIYGEVMYSLDYRPDGDPCWYKWHEWRLCTARNSCENVHNPVCTYAQAYCESFRQTITLPTPPVSCQTASGRPTNQGYQFQCRLTIKGFCRVRALLLKAETMQQELYGRDMVCP